MVVEVVFDIIIDRLGCVFFVKFWVVFSDV